MTKSSSPSPSRKYVAICNKADFSGYYFCRFTLPASYENTGPLASWYFLNCLDAVACIEGVVTNEDFNNVLEVS